MAAEPGSRLTPLPPEGFRRTPWKNGGGVTIDIADAYRDGAAPGSWQGMIWRLGRTAIVAPGPFSDLSGYERLQTVVAGTGLVLETPDGEIDLRRPFTVVRYDGGTRIVSRLEGGPVEVVNLIADRSLCEIALSVAQAGRELALGPGIHVVYAPERPVSLAMTLGSAALDAGHAMRLDTDAATQLTIEAGVAIVATIRVEG